MLYGLYDEKMEPWWDRWGTTAGMPGSSIGFTNWCLILTGIFIQGKSTLASGSRNLYCKNKFRLKGLGFSFRRGQFVFCGAILSTTTAPPFMTQRTLLMVTLTSANGSPSTATISAK